MKWNHSVFAYDVETFPNFCGVGFRDLVTGAVRQFSNVEGVGSTFDNLVAWFADVKNDGLFISFNGLSYDNVMLNKIIVACVTDAAELYELSNRTIAAERVRLHTIDGEIGLDLFAMCGGQFAKLGSLKECGIKLDFPHLQELPYPYDQPLSVDQMRKVMQYNILDLEITGLVAELLRPAIDARIAISIDYSVNVMSAHDAALAQSVMASRLFAAKPVWPSARSWTITGQTLTEGFAYEHPELKALLERIKLWSLRYTVVESRKGDCSVSRNRFY